MGDKGRLVVPAELREQLHLGPGSTLLLLPTPEGFVVTTREHAKALVRRQLAGGSLVDELVSERRTAAAN